VNGLSFTSEMITACVCSGGEQTLFTTSGAHYNNYYYLPVLNAPHVGVVVVGKSLGRALRA
jgi:hypothetical protein